MNQCHKVVAVEIQGSGPLVAAIRVIDEPAAADGVRASRNNFCTRRRKGYDAFEGTVITVVLAKRDGVVR